LGAGTKVARGSRAESVPVVGHSEEGRSAEGLVAKELTAEWIPTMKRPRSKQREARHEKETGVSCPSTAAALGARGRTQAEASSEVESKYSVVAAVHPAVAVAAAVLPAVAAAAAVLAVVVLMLVKSHSRAHQVTLATVPRRRGWVHHHADFCPFVSLAVLARNLNRASLSLSLSLGREL